MVIGWVYGLPLGWLIVVVLGLALGVAASIWIVVSGVAGGGRAQILAAVSPGMLPPLGIVFALVVGFLAANVWSNAADARLAVNREASALRTADLLVDVFPKAEATRRASTGPSGPASPCLPSSPSSRSVSCTLAGRQRWESR